MNFRRPNSVGRAVIAFVLLAQLSALMTPVWAATGAPVPAAAPANKRLAQRALALYQDANYDEAVTLLTGPISRGELKGSELREARIVLARCYVKKGLAARARENFAAILADEPGFVLDSSKADAEEIAAFRELAPALAAKPPAADAAPAAPKSAPKPAAPKEKTPAMRAALPPSSDAPKKGWLSSHKGVALLVAVAGGGAAVALAGAGGSDATPGPVTLTVRDFPPPPTP